MPSNGKEDSPESPLNKHIHSLSDCQKTLTGRDSEKKADEVAKLCDGTKALILYGESHIRLYL